MNEVVIRSGRISFNASDPDGSAPQFGKYVLDPTSKLIPVLYPGVTVPPSRATTAAIFLDRHHRPEQAEARASGRDDPTQHVDRPDAVASQNRLGLLAGQERRLPQRPPSDRANVTDIDAGAGQEDSFTPAFNHAPNNAVLTDGVDSNDKPFTAFPYVQRPESGYDSLK